MKPAALIGSCMLLRHAIHCTAATASGNASFHHHGPRLLADAFVVQYGNPFVLEDDSSPCMIIFNVCLIVWIKEALWLFFHCTGSLRGSQTVLDAAPKDGYIAVVTALCQALGVV